MTSVEFEIVVKRQFEKDFKALNKIVRSRICKSLLKLENDPSLGKRLHGQLKGTYSLRIGVYCVIYEPDTALGRVVLYTVGHRSEIYKK